MRLVPCGGGRAWGEGGDLTCLTRAVIKRVRCGDTCHDDQTFAETGQVFVREGSLLARRPVHAGRASAGREKSAGEETCPCGGGRAWGEGVCWR